MSERSDCKKSGSGRWEGDTRRNQEYFSSELVTCDLVTFLCFIKVANGQGENHCIVDVGYAVIADASLDEFAVLYQKLN